MDDFEQIVVNRLRAIAVGIERGDLCITRFGDRDYSLQLNWKNQAPRSPWGKSVGDDGSVVTRMAPR